MSKTPIIIGGILLTYVGFLFGNMHGTSEAEKRFNTQLEEYNERIKQYVHAINNVRQAVTELIEKASDTSMWQVLDVDGKTFYFTDYATPNNFNRPMNYIWTERGCFAFDVQIFTFEEIYELVMETPAQKQETDYQKFNQGTRIEFSI